jgi:hypothetical protein
MGLGLGLLLFVLTRGAGFLFDLFEFSKLFNLDDIFLVFFTVSQSSARRIFHKPFMPMPLNCSIICFTENVKSVFGGAVLFFRVPHLHPPLSASFILYIPDIIDMTTNVFHVRANRGLGPRRDSRIYIKV